MNAHVERAANRPAVELDLQYAVDAGGLPLADDFQRWAEAALAGQGTPVELVIRIVDEAESRALNGRYRGRDRPTNVLSFPFEAPPGVPSDHLGDLVICAPVVKREAHEQGKAEQAHWAHMTVHGVLHLCGLDHQTGEQAQQMEAMETKILEELGFTDPYA